MPDANTEPEDGTDGAPRPRAPRTMDVLREEAPPKGFFRRHWYVTAALVLLGVLGLIRYYLGSASYIVRRDDVKIATVRRGDFAVDVRANGKLKSKQVYMVASGVSGSVGQILLKAGDAVQVDTPIVLLVNPQLTQELAQARSKLKQVSAERRVQTKELETLTLDAEIHLLTAKNEFQTAQRNLSAQVELSNYGTGLVSALELQQSRASTETQRQIVELSERRVQQMHERLDAQSRAQSVEIEQLRADVETALAQIEQLKVRASLEGTLQSVAVSLGQKLNVGDTVGVVADTTHLIAQLQVPELQVQQVVSGLRVTVDTRRTKIEGQVTRVAPSVEGGVVEVDVALTGEVPPEARADLSVEGLIHVVQLTDVLYVDRPDFAQAGALQNLYRLGAGESRARRTAVKLGAASVNQIQVVSGLQEGDKVIISDTSAFSTHETVVVN